MRIEERYLKFIYHFSDEEEIDKSVDEICDKFESIFSRIEIWLAKDLNLIDYNDKMAPQGYNIKRI